MCRVLGMMACLTVFSVMVAAQEGPRLEGTWKLEKLERDGEPVDLGEWRTYILEKDAYYWVSSAGQKAKGTIKLDTAKKPIEVDYVPQYDEYDEAKGQQGKPRLAIAKLEGDTLTFCNAKAGDKRPDSFTAKKGDGRSIVVLKRVK
jgi:uncharacterized protein (TIGR03067 family)